MSETALAQLPGHEALLTVTEGPHKGAVYRLQMGQVTIGRGSENDIVLDRDPKVSREHVRLKLNAQGASLSNLSENNRVLLAGREIKTALLESGSSFQVGDCVFRFTLPTLEPVSQPPLQIVPPPSMPAAPYRAGAAGTPPRRRQKKPAKSGFYIVVGTVGLLFLWLLTDSGGAKKDKDAGIRTEEQIEADIKSAQDLLEAKDLERKQEGKDSPQYRMAQTHFVQGFRDYQVGQFERALESFQACLSIYPKHALCRRYLNLSQKRFSELVQYHMILGRKYFDQAQYKSCLASFRNVLFMVRDTNSAIYKEAKANYQNCQRLQEDRF